jgi:pyruvate kinase
MMSKARPSVPIFAFTPDPQTYMRMNLLWGVNPLLVPLSQTIEEVIEVVDQTLLSQSLIQPGQQVVLVCGFPIQAIRRTNLTLLHRVGE